MAPTAQVEERKNNLLAMPARKEARFAHTIYQTELLEMLRRSQELSSARDSYTQLRDYIRIALDNGARIEPGLHSAELLTVAPEPYSVTPKPYRKLIVK